MAAPWCHSGNRGWAAAAALAAAAAAADGRSSAAPLGCIWHALNQAAGWQVRHSSSSSSSSAAVSQAVAADPAAISKSTAATSSSSPQQPKQPKQQELSKQQREVLAKAVAAAAEQRQQQRSQLAQLQASYQRSRLQEFYRRHLARELLLKLNLRGVNQLPAVESVVLSIAAKDLTGNRYAEKWEMLLPALALEYISGQPAEFVGSSLKYYRSRNAVTAVKVRLQGGAALDLLQKLTYVVLPSQNAFAGINAKSLDRSNNLHFRIQKMINFPDFEEQFEIFENLGALHVSINIAGVGRQPQRSVLLMTGLHLPMLDKKALAAAAAAAADAEQAAGALSSDEDGGGAADQGGSPSSSSSSDEE